MDQDTLQATGYMLRQLLAGHAYDAIGKKHGITKSAVGVRILRLATELQTVVGVIGVDEDESPSAHLLRRHRSAYLEALEHYVPQAHATPVAPELFDDCRLAGHAERIRRHSHHPLRDAALFLTLFATGARPVEIARLAVHDYLDQQGKVRSNTLLRADIAANGRARALRFRNQAAIDAIDAYLRERQPAGHRVNGDDDYRGLAPASALFLGLTASLPGKGPISGQPGRSIDGKLLHDLLRRIFNHAGLPDMGTIDVRRVVALRLLSDGASPCQIGEWLGLSAAATTRWLRTAVPHNHLPIAPHASPRPVPVA